MVHRRLGRAGALAAIAAACTLVLAAAAGAANRRIAISNYRWSAPDIQVNLGEHVTWYWVGPDTMHSVTGESANAAGVDSDPQTTFPRHPVGDSFAVRFDTPGTYSFVCKLHSTVRGTVTVSPTPGDPQSEPDPVPPSLIDRQAPRVRELSLASSVLRGRGGQLRFSLDERARVEADYYRRGRGGRREFAGWGRWRGYIGQNEIRFGGRAKNFSAGPGRYVAELQATDREGNAGPRRTVRFQIRARGSRAP